MKTKQKRIKAMTEEEIIVAYKNAVCYGRYMGSIYDYMRILGIKKKQQKEVTKSLEAKQWLTENKLRKWHEQCAVSAL